MRVWCNGVDSESSKYIRCLCYCDMICKLYRKDVIDNEAKA